MFLIGWGYLYTSQSIAIKKQGLAFKQDIEVTNKSASFQ